MKNFFGFMAMFMGWFGIFFFLLKIFFPMALVWVIGTGFYMDKQQGP